MDDNFRRTFISANLIPPQIPPKSLLQGTAQKQSAKNQTHVAAAAKTAAPAKAPTAPNQEGSVTRNNGSLYTDPGRNPRASTLPAVAQPVSGNGEGPSVPRGFYGNGSRQPRQFRQSRSQVRKVESYNAPAASPRSTPRGPYMDSYGNRSRHFDRRFRKMPIAFVKAQDPVSDLGVPEKGPEGKQLDDSSSSDEDCGGVSLKSKSPISDLTSKLAAMMQGPGEGAVKKRTSATGDSSKEDSSMLVTNENIHFFPYYTGASAAVNERKIDKPSTSRISLQYRAGVDATCKGSVQAPAASISPRLTGPKDITYKQRCLLSITNTKPGPTDKGEDPIHKRISSISAVCIKPEPTREGAAHRGYTKNLATHTELRPAGRGRNRISNKDASDVGGNRYGQPLLYVAGNPEHRVPNPPRSGVYIDGELVAGSDTTILWKGSNGLKLMTKMGYKRGEGLGRCGDGTLEPAPMVLWKGKFGVGFMYQLPYDCRSEGEGEGEPECGKERSGFRDGKPSRIGKSATTRQKLPSIPETYNKTGEHHLYPDPPADSPEIRYSVRDFYRRIEARDKFDSILEHHELTHRRLGANEAGELYTWCLNFMEKDPGRSFNAEEMESLLKGRYAEVVKGVRGARNRYRNR